ncbi:MAG TPA: S8/S53 family peptidase [Rhizomicrobium sp.]|jgi:hypothetical protein
MAIESSGRIMVRVPRTQFHALMMAPRLGATAGPGSTRPLFAAMHAAGFVTQTHKPAEQQKDWLLHRLPPDERNPWDVAHELVRGKAQGAAHLVGSPELYAEPDLLLPSRQAPQPPKAVRAALAPRAKAPRKGPPYPPDDMLNKHYDPKSGSGFSPAWHLQKDYGNFVGAWSQGKTRGAGIRIAHLDTGYTPEQASKPRNLHPEQGWNVSDDNADIIDRKHTAPWDMPGHGTATLALLAGNAVNIQFEANGPVYNGDLGGAPDASVVPVLIGSSVIHLYTANVAQGLSYALAPHAGGPCDVVSLSHGGLPSNAWADAVNDLYEAGIVVVAASGDSFNLKLVEIATHFTVYPSAFYRVVTATGTTYAKGPYIADDTGAMQGCWGPDAVMKKAIAAYTPNVPWMRYDDTPFGWDMDGGGTSAATPQVAAACALWLAKYGKQFPAGWTRVAACRHALFESVKNKGKDLAHIGVGMLDAGEMLSAATLAKVTKAYKDGKLPHIEPDKVSNPFFRLLFGLPPPGSGVDEMYETEAAQLLFRSKNKELVAAFEADPQGQKKLSPQKAKRLRDAFIREPAISNSLKTHLKAAAKDTK